MDVDWAGNGDHKPRKVLDSTSHNCNAAGGSRQKSPGRLGLGGGTRSLKSFLRKSPSRNQRRSSSRVGSPGRDGIGIGSTKLGAADRFIPNRAAMDFQASHYLLTREVGLSERESKFLCSFYPSHNVRRPSRPALPQT